MKKGLLIGTLGAAALLVGGTFAAYFVNDAAEQKTATIRIKDLIDDEFVTLEWGADTLQNVEELAPGAEAKVGNVTVKASGKDAEGQEIDAEHPYVGYLDLVLDNDLKGHLSVFAKLVQGEEEVAAEGTAITKGMRYEAAVYPEGDKTYAIYVKLDSLGEIGEDLSYVSQGEAALSIDWNMGAESTPTEPEPEAAKYYLVGEVAAYPTMGWSIENGVLMNGEPGENKAALFNVTLAVGDKFKVHGEGEEEWYSPNPALAEEEYVSFDNDGNVVMDTAGIYDIYLNGEDQIWVAAHAGEPEEPGEPGEAETVYFLVGIIDGAEADWSTTPEGKILFTEPNDQDKPHNIACLYGVHLTAGDEIKVVEYTEGEEPVWHPEGDNMHITETGTYNLYLANGGNLYRSEVQLDPGEEPEPLTGEHNFYFTNNRHWNEVYAWVAKTAEGEDPWTAKTEWPGDKLAKVDMNQYNEDIYKVTIDCDLYDVVIFSNDAELGQEQTENIYLTMFGEHDGCYLKENSNQVGFYDYTPSNND